MSLATPAQASWAEFAYSQAGDHRDATVRFEVVNGDLVVRLSNTSMANSSEPNDLIQGVFFNSSTPLKTSADGLRSDTGLAGNPSDRAILPTGSYLSPWDGPDIRDVSTKWAYRGDLDTRKAPAQYGFAAAGLNFFGKHDLLDEESETPGSPSGMDYGLLSKGNIEGDANSSIDDASDTNTPFIFYEVEFVLTDFDFGGLDVTTDITDVIFQYGTTLDKNSTVPSNTTTFTNHLIPTPTASTAGALMMLIVAASFRYRREPEYQSAIA